MTPVSSQILEAPSVEARFFSTCGYVVFDANGSSVSRCDIAQDEQVSSRARKPRDSPPKVDDQPLPKAANAHQKQSCSCTPGKVGELDNNIHDIDAVCKNAVDAGFRVKTALCTAHHSNMRLAASSVIVRSAYQIRFRPCWMKLFKVAR